MLIMYSAASLEIFTGYSAIYELLLLKNLCNGYSVNSVSSASLCQHIPGQEDEPADGVCSGQH